MNFQAKPEVSKIAIDPEKAQEFFQEGVRYYSSRQLKKASQAFQKSLEFDPGNEWARKSLERTLTELAQEKAQQKPAPESQALRRIAGKGDTLRSLAKEFYGDPEKWSVIRDANPQIKDQQEIPAGTIIVIPQTSISTTPVTEEKP